MTRTTKTFGFFLAFLALSLVTAGTASAAATENSRTVVGTVKTIDKTHGVITVDIGLKDVTVAMTTDTEVKGDLAEGTSVRITTSMRNGKRTATSIKVKA